MRICLKCHKNKDLSKFFQDKDTEDGYFDWCQYCVIIAKKRNHNWHRKLKQKCVDYKGGKCAVCGYDTCLAALDFHHINPKIKEHMSGRGPSRRKWDDKTRKELDECILICANCHRELHFWD